jgi:hypothetical protein
MLVNINLFPAGFEEYMKDPNMVVIKIVLMTLILITFSGCSSKELYESIQPKHNENECRKLLPHQYEECMNQKGKTYKEYIKEREEVINQ